MNEARYASLSGNLLARKGAAKPAMRSHMLATRPLDDDLGWNDMGLGDGSSGEEVATDHVPSPITALTPSPHPISRPILPREEPEPVHLQQQAIAERFAHQEPEAAVEPAPVPEPIVPVSVPMPTTEALAKAAALRRPAIVTGRKAAFTLRLDADRHLRLRLASALTGSSSQVLVTNALDALLDTMPDVARLADQVPPSTGDQD